ncbi:MAG TPA: tetratricopeptide repeat protein [Planctomycetaceae bacterium]|nr:tetratricopeptide repeat protein [Planctomycetaceae bacterium]
MKTLRPGIEMRPQPVGLHPFPAGHLLLPAEDDAEALDGLLAGDIDVRFPDAWEFYRLAAQGEVVEARRRLLAAVEEDASAAPLLQYNLFVLDPSAPAYASLRAELAGPIAELLDTAAYAAGIRDDVPSPRELDGELRALALSVSAAADLERGDERAALKKLKDAAWGAREPSPIYAAMLLAQMCDIGSSSGEMAPALVIQGYRQAIDLAGHCRLPRVVPELYLRLGTALHAAAEGRRGMLLQAIQAYQKALQCGACEADCPDLFGQLQSNLGLAYMAMPAMEAGHHLRTGIAIQSFRRALKVFDKERHPDFWASASMNLANALQYAPSSHPEENLIQAVQIYEDVLQVRSRAKDPVAYALVLMNQANALAHLGMFRPAIEKLTEAHKLFQWYDAVDHARAARELLEQIHRHRARLRREERAVQPDAGNGATREASPLRPQ